MKSNQDIRDYAVSHKVLLWECAEKLGIADTTLSKKLRKELTEDKKAEIKAIIDDLAAER